jgi:heme-degrading monooxygenase HmoA
VQEDEMIARLWRGEAEASNADACAQRFTTKVAPHLKEFPGHKGAYPLRREVEGRIEFLAITLWDSIETIKEFTGRDPDVAVIEPEARAVLSAYDDFARNYELIYQAA